MWMGFKSQKGRWIFGLLLLLGLFVRLVVALQPISVLIQKNLPDDAYYYFLIAHNTVQLGSVSLDGINVTNGFHPLWWILLLPIFGWSTQLGDTQVHLALVLASAIDVISIWAVGQIALRLTRREIYGILAGFLYAFNPVVILQVTNGLETALSMAMLSLFFLTFIRWLDDGENNLLTIEVGCLLALSFLARSDSAITLCLALVGALWYWGIKRGFWRVIYAGLIAGVIALPWFVWSRITIGSWLQESGVAVPFAAQNRLFIVKGNSLQVVLDEVYRQLINPPLWLRGDPTGLPFLIGLGIWIIVVIGLFMRWRKKDSPIEKVLMFSLVGGGVVLILVHTGLRWYPRIWYFISMSAAFAIAAVILFDSFIQSNRRIFYSTISLSVYFLISGYIIWTVGYYPWQKDMLSANQWLEKNVPAGARVGSFNSGIYAYYSQRQVVNLDGVVNHSAFEAIKDFNILSYLQNDKIEYLIDYDSAVKREYSPFMGSGYPEKLHEVAIVGGKADSVLGNLRVYCLDCK